MICVVITTLSAPIVTAIVFSVTKTHLKLTTEVWYYGSALFVVIGIIIAEETLRSKFYIKKIADMNELF